MDTFKEQTLNDLWDKGAPGRYGTLRTLIVLYEWFIGVRYLKVNRWQRKFGGSTVHHPLGVLGSWLTASQNWADVVGQVCDCAAVSVGLPGTMERIVARGSVTDPEVVDRIFANTNQTCSITSSRW